MKVVPVVLPNIQWHEFVIETQASLGRSPTRSLDEATVVVGDLKSFVASLAEFQNENSNPLPYLRSRESDRALDMMSVTFLVEARPQSLYAISKFSHVNIFQATDEVGGEDVVLMSGTLRQWRTLIIEMTQLRQLDEVLIEIVKWFIRWGLRDMVASCDFSIERKQLPP